jgi:L-amino acid N-acyltransferase YncA
MRSLSAAASEVGIRRWLAVMFADNFAMDRLLQKFGRKCEEHEIGGGIVEVIYEIAEPPGGFFDTSA